MDDPFTDKAPALGHGLDEESAELAAAPQDSDCGQACGPGEGDATILIWARAM